MREATCMRCEMDKLERGKDLTIKDWINQMETYFIIWQVPPEAFTGCMQMKIAAKHLKEKQRYAHLDYLQFREKLVESFEEPDMATTYLSALQSLCQERGKIFQPLCSEFGRMPSRSIRSWSKINANASSSTASCLVFTIDNWLRPSRQSNLSEHPTR